MDPTQMPTMPIDQSQAVPPSGMPSAVSPAGGVPSVTPGGDQPITDAQRQQLLTLIKQIREKIDALKATRFASRASSDIFRRKILKQVFEKMQMLGIDPGDQEQVSGFIARLREQNPEMADLFENAMNMLLEGQPADQSSQPTDPNMGMAPGMPQKNMNNINPNEAVSQNQ